MNKKNIFTLDTNTAALSPAVVAQKLKIIHSGRDLGMSGCKHLCGLITVHNLRFAWCTRCFANFYLVPGRVNLDALKTLFFSPLRISQGLMIEILF